MFDCAIIGTGPAGISAALNLQIHGISFAWIGDKNLSEKIRRAERISNYPGLPDASGEELSRAFRDQVEKMGITITEGVVIAVYDMGDHYALNLGADFIEARALILTTGVAQKNLLPGEAERMGRGVSYCATCDGGLYRGKTVAVVSTSPRFEHEVKFLADLAERVYFLPAYKNPGEIGCHTETVLTRPKAIEGDGRPLTLRLTDGSAIAADGIFFLRDSVSLSTLLPGLAVEGGHIAVGRDMSTSLKGCFAAGDCTGRPYQYTKAVGEGNIAAHSVIDYLAEIKK